jgi:hypothetical protein
MGNYMVILSLLGGLQRRNLKKLHYEISEHFFLRISFKSSEKNKILLYILRINPVVD